MEMTKIKQSFFYQLTAERDYEILLCLQTEDKPWCKIWDIRESLVKGVGLSKNDGWTLVVRKITPQYDSVLHEVIIKERYDDVC